MDVLRYLVAVILLAGLLAYGAYWTITPPSGAAVTGAQATETRPAANSAAAARSDATLAALSPIYPTMVGKGLPPAGPSAERMRKHVQGNVAERPRKKS